MLHERLGYSPDVIEAQPAHTVRDSLGRAHKQQFVEQRREMLQTWANYLDQLRSGKDVLPPQRKGQPTRQSRPAS
jgi:hypothetical protein